MTRSDLDEVLAEEEAPLRARKLLHQGRLKCPAVLNEFGGLWRDYGVTWIDLNEVQAEEEVPLGARKLLHQGRLKRPPVLNEFEGL